MQCIARPFLTYTLVSQLAVPSVDFKTTETSLYECLVREQSTLENCGARLDGGRGLDWLDWWCS